MASYLQKKRNRHKVIEESNREWRTSIIYTVSCLMWVLGASAYVYRAVPVRDWRQFGEGGRWCSSSRTGSLCCLGELLLVALWVSPYCFYLWLWFLAREASSFFCSRKSAAFVSPFLNVPFLSYSWDAFKHKTREASVFCILWCQVVQPFIMCHVSWFPFAECNCGVCGRLGLLSTFNSCQCFIYGYLPSFGDPLLLLIHWLTQVQHICMTLNFISLSIVYVEFK